MPLARVPMHVSYLLQAHEVSPVLAKAYFRAGLAACRLRGVGPSLLLHPLDFLDGKDAARLEFFPGMALPAATKVRIVKWAVAEMQKHFTVVGTGEHARRLLGVGVVRTKAASGAGPRNG
jgi:hypothetical protein